MLMLNPKFNLCCWVYIPKLHDEVFQQCKVQIIYSSALQKYEIMRVRGALIAEPVRCIWWWKESFWTPVYSIMTHVWITFSYHQGILGFLVPRFHIWGFQITEFRKCNLDVFLSFSPLTQFQESEFLKLQWNMDKSG